MTVLSKYFGLSTLLKPRRRLLHATCVVTVIVAGCATYDGTRLPPPADANGTAGLGTGGDSASGSGGNLGGAATAAGTANVGGDSQSEAGHGGDAGDAGEGGSSSHAGSGNNAGNGGIAGAGGKGGNGGAGGKGGNGGAGAGGKGGNGGAGAGAGAGTGGTGGSGGAITAGAAGSVGAGAGGAPADVLLSQSKPVVADSTETGNVATYGNDGSASTRWCAANSGLNHYWQVDLGASHTLVRIDITWEKSANYKFKIEGSSDNNAWAMLLDQQATTGSASMQSYALNTSPIARWVRITVTGLPNSTTWASFYELQVFGH